MSFPNLFTQKSILYLMLSFLPVSLFADTIPIVNWLHHKGPELTMPAFHETEDINGEAYTQKDLFNSNPVDLKDHFPRENDALFNENGNGGTWNRSTTDDNGFITLEKSGEHDYETAYLATYMKTSRWMKAEIDINSRQMLEVYLNGERLGSKTTTEAADEEPGTWNHEAELPAGKHLIMVRTLHIGEEESSWQVSGRVNLPSYVESSDVEIELNPLQGKNINHLLNGIKAGTASLSPDARYYAIRFSRNLPGTDKSENWLEIKQVDDGKLVQSFRHSSIQSFSWAPRGSIFSYRTMRDGKTTIWIHDLDEGRYHSLLEDMEDFSSYSWSPDGTFIVYSLKEEVSGEDDDLKRLLGMQDRLPGYRTRHFLYMADVKTGIKTRLTHGHLTTSLHDICPGNKKILFSQSRPDYQERPYSKQDVFVMDINSKEVDTILHDMRWSVSGQFSPDGKKILFTGGPSAFGGLGENIPGGMIANNYDTQAYIYDLETGITDPFTREFAPSVSRAIWNEYDNRIYLVAADEDFVHLFRYDRDKRNFSKVNTGEDVVSWIRMADNAPFAVFSGSGMSSPPKVSLMDLRNLNYTDLENPDKKNYRNVVFGSNREWNFKNSEGTEIKGRVYLPLDFDKTKKYPLIVYYYGGTSPVSRSFGGRYPFNMYAANGYVVYVLQPSGATGFGQEFSARHVNNWGETVADEIIMGTRLFHEDHPFVDPDRIGCMGASYGGFMTMLLQTRTDIFAAAISHAGISSISSYWGEGYWGYGYSAEASAGSFPWNNRELYVDRSPLFNADKIETPLLLLHGSSDTNVPPGESIQMYAALKMLGRPVELIKIEGEDHHIITYSKRIEWSDTKLAWFDKWLKGQQQWWEAMYPDKNY